MTVSPHPIRTRGADWAKRFPVSAPRANLVNFYANDPEAKGTRLEQVALPPEPSHFVIPGWKESPGLFDPGTPEFQGGQLHVVLNRTYSTWRHFFGADFNWQSGDAELIVHPRALDDWNAYYDREALRFCYKYDESTGRTLYSCESSDIVAHECGHAILDAHQPDYWDSLYPETVAFHEAFGDISSILVTLVDSSVRRILLEETGGDLAQSNLVTRLAEQFAGGLYRTGRLDAVVSSGALRDIANTLRYREPDDLPARAPASTLSSESHSLSRVFSGAVYDLLVGIFERLRNVDPGLAADVALCRACSTVGHLLGQAILMAPRGDIGFKTIATAIFDADTLNFGGKHLALLRQVFVGRRVLRASEANALGLAAGPRYTLTSTLGLTASAVLEAPIHLDIDRTDTRAELPSALRGMLRLPKQDYWLSGERRRRDTGRVLHYVSPHEVRFENEELGAARGVLVTLMNAIAVHVDRNGRVLSVLQHRADRALEARIRDHLQKIIGQGRLCESAQGERADPRALIERGQPYYVAYDPQGNKHVRRAFIACSVIPQRVGR